MAKGSGCVLEGYVELYTDIEGFQEFLDLGYCTANIKKDGKFEFKIIVPIKAVETEGEDPAIAYRIKYNVKVNLKK
jgi:hypothetical protein